ncbi:MAG TPA: Minf_1886 family protein [bacterium]|nr:Minf_1886 family protein [bacterium]
MDRTDLRMVSMLRADDRYSWEAYEFTRQAVTYASDVLFATETHVSGKELLEAVRRLGPERYGVMTREVFASWGVNATDDFGEIVFNLVDAGLLSKTEEDSRDDFRAVYSFDEAFSPAAYWQEVLESSV